MARDRALRWKPDNDAVPQEELVEHEFVKRVYDGEEFEIPFLKIKTPNDQFTAFPGHGFYPPFNQRTYECLPGIVCEQDVANKLRDGRTMYSDIYRPIGERNLPVILCWTNYGKRPQEIPYEWDIPGVPPGTRSPYVAFETADPDYWCRHGYAVAITDAPGAGYSEGDCDAWGWEYAEHCYDYIEWIAQQWWCNGKVAMVGNSSLAMCQWLVGQMNPPHLACLAPWEGTADIYREFICPGGIVNYGQWDAIGFGLGRQGSRQEDLIAAFYKYPLYNAYWESKRPKAEKITVPVYATGSWSHLMHLRGATNCFRALPEGRKWLRLHREMEWQDFHTPKQMQDLMRFLDRYAKGIHNGWELTPMIRLDVQDAYEFDHQIERPEEEWPLARTQYTKLYLDATKASLSEQASKVEAKVSYDAVDGETYFEIEFQEETELTGYFKAHLWVEADGSDDMDIHVTCQKYNSAGEFIPTYWWRKPHLGAWGILRASHRELDIERTTDFQPWHTHTSEQLLKPGEIVPLEIELWPHSKIWHRGERLRMYLSGNLKGMGGWWIPEKRNNRNAGKHIIHTGGRYDSYLQVPVVPPRYQSGDFAVR